MTVGAQRLASLSVELSFRRVLMVGVGVLLLTGCNDTEERRTEERRDVGASDGYAVGYNTTCKIRATLVDGDFKNKDYAQAYEEGYEEGAAACRAADKGEIGN